MQRDLVVGVRVKYLALHCKVQGSCYSTITGVVRVPSTGRIRVLLVMAGNRRVVEGEDRIRNGEARVQNSNCLACAFDVVTNIDWLTNY